MIHRYSSRRSPLKDFLAKQLQDARRYDRIAGFFSSSLLEVAGEALERMRPERGESCVRVVCNSSLHPLDVQTARAAKWGMHREWCASLPAEIGTPMKARLQRLYEFLDTGLLKVRVLPDEAFGLVHGKAGVITRTDGVRFERPPGPEGGPSKQQSQTLVDNVFELIKKALESGDDVLISGLGKFIVREKAQRMGRNLATGGDFTPVARRVVIFKSSFVLRDKLQ
jgi:nucleoid DNA-binding protein